MTVAQTIVAGLALYWLGYVIGCALARFFK